MATVVDRSGNGVLDKSFVNTNRSNAGDPNGVLTPQFAGERVKDTTNSLIWQAKDIANNSWVTSNSIV